MRIVHNPAACASLGMCEAVSPKLFEIRSDGALHLLDPDPPESMRDLVDEAVEACPTGALSVQD